MEQLSSALLRWYDLNRRALPWRDVRDPYRVWLSEVMLQQTQTQTVMGYYARFLERFPDVFALAEAPEQDVLKLWEGLGYYSRARNLHAAARLVVGELGGAFPQTSSQLRRLPGVGPYAANAIASIAFGEPAPALDGNQARVLSRVLAWEPVLRTPFDLLEPALERISRERPGDYNQALMDLGATICTPKAPRCGECPLSGHCQAFAADAVLDFPKKQAPVPKMEEDWCIVLPFLKDRLLTRRRPTGLLGGLYEFCAFSGHFDAEALAERLQREGFANPRDLRQLPDAKHVFTHRVWRMQGWMAACDAAPTSFTPVDAAALEALPFPSALRVYRRIAAEALRS